MGHSTSCALHPPYHSVPISRRRRRHCYCCTVQLTACAKGLRSDILRLQCLAATDQAHVSKWTGPDSPPCFRRGSQEKARSSYLLAQGEGNLANLRKYSVPSSAISARLVRSENRKCAVWFSRNGCVRWTCAADANADADAVLPSSPYTHIQQHACIRTHSLRPPSLPSSPYDLQQFSSAPAATANPPSAKPLAMQCPL